MESDTSSGIFGLNPSTMAMVLIVVFFGLWAAYKWYYGGVTVPLPSYKTGFVGSMVDKAKEVKTEGFLGGRFTQGGRPLVNAGTSEGFGGAAKGTGSPDCLRSSSEGAELIAMFEGRNSSYEEGSDDLRELTQLMSKLLCFKKDLVSPSFIVEATRYQKYMTSHDIEPIAETTGRCFAKTVGPRDLGLAFDKWTSRGELLVKKLCTSYKLNPTEVERAQKLFRFVIRDVRDIANGACLEGEPMIAGKPGPRDAHPFESPDYAVIGEYNGYY
jgi:hypothetical protein